MAPPVATVADAEPSVQSAQREVEQLRAQCLSDQGGPAVLQAVNLCALHNLLMPAWLRDEYVKRHHLVADAHARSWDDAFGRPWPKRTRLATVRRRRVLIRRVHTEVWKLAASRPDLAIKRELFDMVGELEGIHLEGSTVDRLYYAALRAGFVNVAEWRRAMGLKAPATRTRRKKA
ncbi:MAG: hypothetical protein RIQ60_2612 [Pseudomonadota bacterium]|jgi:hypothetical protein